jgi:flagellar motility protein MotE (MotC chaperone)
MVRTDRSSRWLRRGLGLILFAKLSLVGFWAQGALSGAAAAPAANNQAAPSTAKAQAPGLEPAPAPPASKAPAAPAAADKSPAGSETNPGAMLASANVKSARSDAPAAKSLEARSLLDAVARRQAELDAREEELNNRDERLKLFEKDVTTKIAALEEIEKRLAPRVKASNAAGDSAAESLAKVYGAMKASEAAPILEQLDEATVLRIFGRMKEKQLGEILPLMNRDKAIGLTRSLADRR